MKLILSVIAIIMVIGLCLLGGLHWKNKYSSVNILDSDVKRSEEITKEAKVYKVMGQIRDAITGMGVSGIRYICIDVTSKRIVKNSLRFPSGENGEFLLQDMKPGSYKIYAFLPDSSNMNQVTNSSQKLKGKKVELLKVDTSSFRKSLSPNQSFPAPAYYIDNYYSEKVSFRVMQDDIRGIEINLRKSGTVNGRVLIDGESKKSLRTQFSQLFVSTSQIEDPGINKLRAQVANDGSFRLDGIPSGKMSFFVKSYLGEDFSLIRIEHDGVRTADGIEIGSGNTLSKVLLVLSRGKSEKRS